MFVIIIVVIVVVVVVGVDSRPLPWCLLWVFTPVKIRSVELIRPILVVRILLQLSAGRFNNGFWQYKWLFQSLFWCPRPVRLSQFCDCTRYINFPKNAIQWLFRVNQILPPPSPLKTHGILPSPPVNRIMLWKTDVHEPVESSTPLIPKPKLTVKYLVVIGLDIP